MFRDICRWYDCTVLHSRSLWSGSGIRSHLTLSNPNDVGESNPAQFVEFEIVYQRWDIPQLVLAELKNSSQLWIMNEKCLDAWRHIWNIWWALGHIWNGSAHNSQFFHPKLKLPARFFFQFALRANTLQKIGYNL